MKTALQTEFENHIIKGISHYARSPQQCYTLMSSFVDISEPHYELLCSNIYTMTTKPSVKSLWFRSPSYTYLSSSSKGSHDLCLLKADEVKSFDGDIVENLQLCCQRLKQLSDHLVSEHERLKTQPC